MKNLIKALVFAFTATVLFAQTNPLNLTTMEVVKDMGLGINLGNTMEALIVCDAGNVGCENWANGMDIWETAWGSPEITEDMIKGYVDAGFKTVRIPVSWSNKMIGDSGGTYTISATLMDRVEEIVNYVLDNGMYAIVNIHYDGGWWKNFPTDSAESMKKYTRIWEQVSSRFKDYGGNLIFESLNEEGVWDDVWYIWKNPDDMAAKARVYGILNAINQEFTDLVRASGGNNAKRHLLIAGYATNIDRTIDAMFKMPQDSENRQAVSVHYYDPFGFSHLDKDEDWAEMRETWGTQADYNELNGYMDKLKTSFVDKGVPVIVGEYGFAAKLTSKRTEEEVRKYTLAVAEAIYERDMCPILWDVQLDKNDEPYYYNRNTSQFSDPLLVEGFKEIAGGNTLTPIIPQIAKNSYNKMYYKTYLATTNNMLTLKNVPSNAKIDVYNLQGKHIYSFINSKNSKTLKVPVSAKGMYLATIKL